MNTTDVDVTPVDVISHEFNDAINFIKLLDDTIDNKISISIIYKWYKFVTSYGCAVKATKESLSCTFQKDEIQFDFSLSWKNDILVNMNHPEYRNLRRSPMEDCDYDFEKLINRYVRVIRMFREYSDIKFAPKILITEDLKRE